MTISRFPPQHKFYVNFKWVGCVGLVVSTEPSVLIPEITPSIENFISPLNISKSYKNKSIR